jgi:hypothetical protein
MDRREILALAHGSVAKKPGRRIQTIQTFKYSEPIHSRYIPRCPGMDLRLSVVGGTLDGPGKRTQRGHRGTRATYRIWQKLDLQQLTTPLIRLDFAPESGERRGQR